MRQTTQKKFLKGDIKNTFIKLQSRSRLEYVYEYLAGDSDLATVDIRRNPTGDEYGHIIFRYFKELTTPDENGRFIEVGVYGLKKGEFRDLPFVDYAGGALLDLDNNIYYWFHNPGYYAKPAANFRE